jgi:Cu/Ag efflux pump CusA
VLTGSSEAITVRIYGPDLVVLGEKAAEVNELLGDVPGIVENHVEFQEDIPQVRVEVDLQAADDHGVKPGDVRRAAAYMVAGEEAGDLFRSGKAYDVQLWTPPEARQTLTDIEQLPIDTPTGERVPLEELADIAIVPTPNVINHENLARNIDVGANIDGSRDLGSVVEDVEAQLASVEWPLEFRAELLGEFQERQAAQGRLTAFAVAAAIAVFLLLQTSFRSWRLASLYFVTLPIALVGGVLAAYLGGGIISLGSLVGFFTVLGIVARNGIMLISHYQHLEHVEGVPFGTELILRGAGERIVPILMTVFTTGLALLPLVLSGQIPGQEVEYPMAIVILGGLTTATLLNLFVVPPLYLRFAKGWSRSSSAKATAPRGD